MRVGKRIRAAGRILNHPIIQATGNALTILTLLPFVIAGAAIVVGRATDETFLFLVAICLALGGIALVLVLALLQRRGPVAAGATKRGLGPEERLRVMDDLFYPPADPRLELGEECEKFAMKVHVFIEEEEEARVANTASVVRELLDANPELDHEQASKDAQGFVDRRMEKTYQLTYREDGLRLFDEARGQDAIAAKGRRAVESPNAYDMAEVPNMFRAIARRLGVAASEPDPSPTPPSLAATLDDMIREGMDLRHELEASGEPEETSPGTWSVVGGVPEGWWEKVDAFDQRLRDLLRAERPALLSTFEEGHNSAARRLREADENRASPSHKADTRSDAQKAVALMNWTREGPMLHMDCILDGLSAARRQLGMERP